LAGADGKGIISLSINDGLPRYSVIVPAYREEDRIGDCVHALVDQSIPRSDYEIIVIDDASPDDTGVVAQDSGADVVYRIDHGGASAARNAGVARARGDLVLFTDADCIPCREWVERMVAPFADPDIAGVKGTYRSRQTPLMARLVQLEFVVRYERMATLPEIDFIDTYAAAYRRSILDDEGGFDTEYPVPSAEDVDLSFRLAQKGYRMVFVPDAWVWHVHPTSVTAYLKRKMRFGYWRALLYIRYPNKIAGDAHTDPLLKLQFALVGLVGLQAAAGLFYSPFWIGAVLALLVFCVTTLSFVGWAWSRDRAVALVWPAIAFLRVLLQGMALAVGLMSNLVSGGS
jgi:cellulose synthase/poly-beta-1,6-N-acetylglucosamine synthase-like glycosyltransferase